MIAIIRWLAVSSVGVLVGMTWLGGLTSAAQGQDRPPPRETPLLTVTGEAETSANPDRAHLRLGASIEAESAAAAQEQVNQIMTRAGEALRNLQIPEEKIQTAELSIFPVYIGEEQRGPGAQMPRVRGYRASNAVMVQVDDLQLVGKVIDAAVGAGANSLDSLRFSLRDDTEARKQALQRAARNAASNAEAIAQAMDLKLGPIHEIVEGGVGFFPPEPRMGRAVMAEMATPIQPGQLTVSASITVSYRIRAADVPMSTEKKQ